MKHPIKMIVTDLDGTLLRDDKSISGPAIAALGKCRESGVKVVYATGRGSSADALAPSHLFDGRIVMNGAVARVNDTVVYSRLIPYRMARPLLMACDRQGLKTSSDVSGMHYSNFKLSDVWPQITYFRIVDFSKHDVDSEKLCVCVDKPEDAEFIRKNLPDDLHMHVSNDGLAMIMHRDATKAKAAGELARLWEISREEIVAFGDDLNDMDMLSYAGIGVAMGNALDEVKAIAGFVALSNEEDGLADWITKNLF
jgi:Cof subfamily protein (haloacid dehalogenase superfamily)